MIKNFIWDFDGTLFDTYPLLAQIFHTTLQNHSISESIDSIIGYMKISMSYSYRIYSNKYQLSDQFFCEYEAFVDQYERKCVKPFKHAKIICESIVNNSGHNFLFTHRGSSAIDYLKDAAMESYFTECITADYGFKRKPDPEAITYLIEKYHLNSLETVMIGDRDIDILSGKNAGILTCYCDKDQTRKPDYANYSFPSLEFISELLN